MLDRTTLIAHLQRPANDAAALRPMLPYAVGGAPDRPLTAPPDAHPRRGAVLILLYPQPDDWYLPLTVRTTALRQHSGEVSLPGGRYDDEDGSLERTALREAEEELGISTAAIEVVATLLPFWIPVSNFTILPVVGLTAECPHFSPARAEVALLLEAALTTLCAPATRQTRVREVRGQRFHAPYFALHDHEVWGATALVLAQLVGRLAE